MSSLKSAAASEKKPENFGGKKSGESANQKQQPSSLSTTSLIKLQPQDPNFKSSAEKHIPPFSTTIVQIEKDEKLNPASNFIAAAINPNQKIPEATTPPQPSPKKASDAESVATSATLKFEKQFPEATTPPLPTPKSTDSGTNAASASLKFEKQC
uniref:Uncharacterized protein n=1 Tax=Panagrolaimus sp. ES5 TaxID=591445 RepID=A0AC34FTM6_9BILA